MNDVHFSSKDAEWSTPQTFFDRLTAEFGPFDLDVCATADNAKCERYYTKDQDGLSQPWTGKCWMNPPYGRGIGKWIEKAVNAALEGATVVCLVPARTDTRWWHDYVIPCASHIRFIKGRIKFGGARYNAPFPNAVVVFEGRLPPIMRILTVSRHNG